MLNLLLWLSLLAGFFMLVGFAWRSAMRRRGFRLLKLLEAEHVLRYAVDVPVAFGDGAARPSPFSRRGTVVLTRKRLAGFAHRSRFVLVRGGGARSDAVQADGEWLIVKPRASSARAPSFRFYIPDAPAWSRDARKVLRL